MTTHAQFKAERYADAERTPEVLSGNFCRRTGDIPMVEAIVAAANAYWAAARR
jgi:xanthine dehydrogenase iron-sulfur cluster and FAD-binding subunit A